MATLTLLGRPSSGGHPAAVAADILIGSNFKSHASTALTLEAAATQMLLKVNGATLLTLSGASTTTLTSAGTTQIDAPTGGTVAFTINGVGQLSVSATGINAQAALAMSSNKITGVLQGTAADEALCYPWIGNARSSSVLSSTYTISADNGAYEDTGLSVALPSAGVYLVGYTARTNIVAAASGSDSYILTELFNSSDATAVTSSEEIGAYATTASGSYYGVSTVILPISVAAAKTIKLYAKSIAVTSNTTRTVNSDANGRTTLWYVKIA